MLCLALAHRGSASISRSDGSSSSPPPTDCRHSWGILYCGYLQWHEEFYQQHCGWHPRTPTRKLWVFDASQTPQAQRHSQEDDLPSLITDHDRLFRHQRIHQVFQHQRNLVHAAPSRQCVLRDHTQYGQVFVRNSLMEPHDKHKEDVVRFQAVF